MAEELRRFPPTALKLEKLRKAGIVPFSEDVMCFAVFLGAGLGAWLCLTSSIAQVASLPQHLWTIRYDETALAYGLVKKAMAAHFEQTAQVIFLITLAFIIPLVCLLFLIGGLQTRFLFSIEQVSPDFGRFFRFGAWIWQGLFVRLLSGFVRLLKVLCWIIVSVMILGYLITEELPFAPVESAKMLAQEEVASSGATSKKETTSSRLFIDLAGKVRLGQAQSEVGSFWFCVLVFSFFMGILSRFVTVLRFRQSYRMTRSELEAEYRETEQSSEMKGAQREISSNPEGVAQR
jgi:flagellar biosynthesis protein FlhB